MLRVTVKQINDAVPSSDFKTFRIRGVDVTSVVMWGIAFEKSERNNRVTFMLDDCTGCIQCHKWVICTFDTREVGILSHGAIVRVHGYLKRSKDKMQVEVLGIRPLGRFDEVSDLLVMKMKALTLSTQNSSADQVSGPKTINQMVAEYLELPFNVNLERGVHVNKMATNLNLPMENVREAIYFLEAEGMVMSTIDDDHFKAIST